MASNRVTATELETLLKKLQKMRPSGSVTEQICEKISPEGFLDDPGTFVLIDDPIKREKPPNC